MENPLFVSIEQTDRKTERELEHAEDQRKNTWMFIALFVVLGLIGIIIVSLCGKDGCGFLTELGSGLLLAGASMAVGGITGFIFGIPSFLQDGSASIRYNDNFVQISDWLTKIIVGVGLTQLMVIPEKLNQLGASLQDNFGGSRAGGNIALAIIFYYLVLGFLTLYFWTRTDFTRILKLTDDDVRNKLVIANRILERQQQRTEQQNKLNADIKERKVLEKHLSETGLSTVTLPPATHPDDPQKDRFGGLSERNGRKLSATVTPYSIPTFFKVVLTVESTDPNRPLTGPVLFFLHHTFNPSVYAITPDQFMGGKAVDEDVIAWGAFTVGVITDDGQTLLELDLAEDASFPKEFRDR